MDVGGWGDSLPRMFTKVWPWRRGVVWLLLSLIWITAVGADGVVKPPQMQFTDSVNQLLALFSPTNQQTLSGTLEVVRAQGLPSELAGMKWTGAVQFPDRAKVSGSIKKEALDIGRLGDEMWILQPGKRFGVHGAPGRARFSTAPDVKDASRMGPLALPVPPEQLAVIPLMFRAEEMPGETVDGSACRVIRATLAREAQAMLKTGPMVVTLALRASDGLPIRIGYSDGRKTDVVVQVRGLRVETAWPEERWRMEVPEGVAVEKVAISHLQKFLPAALRVVTTKATSMRKGEGREVVARHGQGRLELHDGTRVLFLEGTPEEMGEQHGTLLRREVRDLVERVLYGVGVGSSFEKGRWFLGEIEQCQARIGRFTDARYTREMDAIAMAAGLDREEVRLANFFPELFHCSGYALLPGATVGGRIFHGRVLDYMKGIGLEPNAVVIVHRPDVGHAWANVSYAGFVGTVTAMNDQHISIGEMGGRGEGQWDGKPMAQLLREVMESATNLEEAVAILRKGPRTCEYYYVIADGKTGKAVGIAATPTTFEVVEPGAVHERLPHAVPNAVLLSAGDRYEELVRRVKAQHGKFDAASARDLMTRPVCMKSNIHSVLFAPDTLDFWVANSDGEVPAAHCRYFQYNLKELLRPEAVPVGGK
jgi:hypothetical protein